MRRESLARLGRRLLEELRMKFVEIRIGHGRRECCCARRCVAMRLVLKIIVQR